MGVSEPHSGRVSMCKMVLNDQRLGAWVLVRRDFDASVDGSLSV